MGITNRIKHVILEIEGVRNNVNILFLPKMAKLLFPYTRYYNEGNPLSGLT